MSMLTPFLQYVAEGRVVRRQSDLQRYTFQEICEKIYLSFLTLSLLKNFTRTKGFAKTYANQTLAYGEFARVRTTANDLHNMLAIVSGDPAVVEKLANKNAAMALRQRLSIPVLAIRRYLRAFSNDYKFLTQKEGKDYSLLLGPLENKDVNNLVTTFISRGYKKNDIILE